MNQSNWLKMQSPFGNDEYIPRLIDITAGNLREYAQKWSRMKCFSFLLLFLLFILLILLSILLLIYLSPCQSTIILSNLTNVSKSTTTRTTTTELKCEYPEVMISSIRCVNIMLDSTNCGSIGNECETNSSCSAGVCSFVPGVELDEPISIWSSPINGSADDQMFNVSIPWNITLYNQSTNEVIVTTDGVLCFGGCATTYTESSLPANVFDGVTVLPFWDDLYIYGNTSQGIYYQSEGKSPDRRLIFEYYMSHYVQPNEYYHFQIIFFEHFPGIVEYKYFDASDGGDTCTIGVQASKMGPFILYSYDQEQSVQDNLLLTFDTNQGTFNKSIFK